MHITWVRSKIDHSICQFQPWEHAFSTIPERSQLRGWSRDWFILRPTFPSSGSTAHQITMEVEGPSLGWIKLVADAKRRQQHAFATGCSPNQCSSLTSIPQCRHASSTNSDRSCASVSCHLNARNAWVSLCTYHRKKRSAPWSQSAIKEKLLTFNVSNGASIVLFPSISFLCHKRITARLKRSYF